MSQAANSTEAVFARWQQHAVEDAEVRAELQRLAAAAPAERADAFYRQLAFGTGGLRGVMGAGPNRMNIYTVRRASQGLAAALRRKKQLRGVAVAYDSREKSDVFAAECARVLAGNGVFVWLFPRLMPTPVLSFAVRHLGCSAGVCITASHNPAQYNGYKVYGPDGGQVTTATAGDIADEMAEVDPFTGVKLADFDKAVDMGMIRYVDDAVVSAFLDAVAAQSMERRPTTAPLRVVYTPLHGTGTECVMRILQRIGIEDVHLVTPQVPPDGLFTTCPSPNPENPDALHLGVEALLQEQADLLLATDPDCDRVGVVVRTPQGPRRLTGNEVGVLLLDYICAMRRLAGRLPNAPVAVSTIVSTAMADSVAAAYGATVRRVLTGFKYIGEQIGLLERAGQAERFVLGFEESCGYLSGGYVRDKDGVGASMLVCEMARWYKDKGRNLAEVLQDLYRQHGAHHSTLHSFVYPGQNGAATMQTIMARLRQSPPQAIAGVAVTARRDYLQPLPGAGSDGAVGEAPAEETATGKATGHREAEQAPALPPADVLEYHLNGGSRVLVRPSGTEPKVKLYIETVAENEAAATAAAEALYQDMNRLLLADAPPPQAEAACPLPGAVRQAAAARPGAPPAAGGADASRAPTTAP